MKKNTMFVMVLFFFLALAGNTVMGQQRGGCFTTMNRPAPCGGSHFSNPCGGCGISHTGPCASVGGILQQLLCSSCHGPQHSGPCGGGVGFNAWGGGAPVLAPSLNINLGFGGRTTVSNVPAQAYQNKPTDENGRIIPLRQASSAQGSEDDDGGNERLRSQSSASGSPTGYSVGKLYLDAEIAQVLQRDKGFDSIQIYLGTEVVLEQYEISRKLDGGTVVKSPQQMVFRTNLLGVADSVAGEIDEIAPGKIVVRFSKTNQDMILPFWLDDEDHYVFSPNPEDAVVTDGQIYQTIYIHGKRWMVISGYEANALYKEKNDPEVLVAKGVKIRR